MNEELIVDRVLAEIEKAGAPLNSSELYQRIDIATSRRQISNAVYRLSKKGRIVRHVDGTLTIAPGRVEDEAVETPPLPERLDPPPLPERLDPAANPVVKPATPRRDRSPKARTEEPSLRPLTMLANQVFFEMSVYATTLNDPLLLDLIEAAHACMRATQHGRRV